MITVNDQARPELEGRTVHEVLAEMDPRMPIAAVRLNGDYLPRARWKDTRLADGDELRVVYIIAGG